jgi:TRAP-type C4-dicarboxylate transport system substrate-binding protein
MDCIGQSAPKRQFFALIAGLALALFSLNTQAQRAPSLTLRVIGGLGGVNQYVHHEEPFWLRDLPGLSEGKYAAQIAPFDRSGVPGEEMLRLMSLGVVPFGTALLGLSSAQHPMLGMADLAGLNPDIGSLKRNVDSFRPTLQKTLRDKHGIELLAVYTYPAQMLFCKKAFSSLRDLAKRRVRVSSPSQADLMQALGAVPVLVGFSQIMTQLQSGNTECAITGTMSGNTIGLHAVTSHIYNLPLTWGLAIFAANGAAWASLPGDLRALLRREIPRLEDNIWAASKHETDDGLACNRGDPQCTRGTPGTMTQINPSPADIQLLQELLRTVVVPRWQQRCNQHCQTLWNSTIGAPPAKAPALDIR